jgi:hypothetical protein
MALPLSPWGDATPFIEIRNFDLSQRKRRKSKKLQQGVRGAKSAECSVLMFSVVCLFPAWQLLERC